MPTFTQTCSGATNDGGQDLDSTDFDTALTTDTIKASTAGAAARRSLLFRFTSVTVPQNSLVKFASLGLHKPNAGAPIILSDIYCDDVDNSPALSDPGADIVDDRTQTTASVFWVDSFTPPITVSTSITDPVQEVIDRAGWASGNALSVIVQGSALAIADADIHMVGAANPASIIITYTSPPTKVTVRAAKLALAADLL